MHDLRHTFALQTLLDWYRSGSDVERHLPILSTFLGHSHVENTYWYYRPRPSCWAPLVNGSKHDGGVHNEFTESRGIA
jgi:integrase